MTFLVDVTWGRFVFAVGLTLDSFWIGPFREHLVFVSRLLRGLFVASVGGFRWIRFFIRWLSLGRGVRLENGDLRSKKLGQSLAFHSE